MSLGFALRFLCPLSASLSSLRHAPTQAHSLRPYPFLPFPRSSRPWNLCLFFSASCLFPSAKPRLRTHATVRGPSFLKPLVALCRPLSFHHRPPLSSPSPSSQPSLFPLQAYETGILRSTQPKILGLCINNKQTKPQSTFVHLPSSSRGLWSVSSSVQVFFIPTPSPGLDEFGFSRHDTTKTRTTHSPRAAATSPSYQL